MTKKPVDFDELFSQRFLKAGLLRGKPATLTIADVDVEPLPQDNGKDRDRGIISFAGTDKQLVLNKTNGECFRAMFGRKVADWIGKRITLVPATDRFGSKIVDCIRVAGSPDIESAIEVEITMPRKKPKMIRLERTGQQQPKAEEPSK
jgi:hypothetical protein